MCAKNLRFFSRHHICTIWKSFCNTAPSSSCKQVRLFSKLMSRYTVEGGGVGTLLVLVVILSKYRYKSEFNEWNEGGVEFVSEGEYRNFSEWKVMRGREGGESKWMREKEIGREPGGKEGDNLHEQILNTDTLASIHPPLNSSDTPPPVLQYPSNLHSNPCALSIPPPRSYLSYIYS